MRKPTKQKYIHNYDEQYNAYSKRLENSSISKTTKKLILEFENQCNLKEKIALPTRLKYLQVLILIAEKYSKEDFDKLNKKDFENIVLNIEENEELTISSKQKYRAILKKFGRWLAYRDEMFIPNGIKKYPDNVAWINTNIKAKDKPRIKSSEILSEEEVEKIINSAETPQHKAFISMLYELGARIGEIGMLSVGDVERDNYSFIVDLSGKTGHRTPRIIMSDPYLANWLNQHPLKDDPKAPLWISKDRKTKQFTEKRLNYRALLFIINRLVKRAGIKKYVYPHLFRHSRVTHLLKNKQISEQMAKTYFGWSPASKVLSEYSHLVSADVNDALLEINGIKTSKEATSRFKTKQCMACKKINPKDMNFCGNCTKPLDFETMEKIDRTGRIIMEKLQGLSQEDILKVLEKSKGLK